MVAEGVQEVHVALGKLLYHELKSDVAILMKLLDNRETR